MNKIAKRALAGMGTVVVGIGLLAACSPDGKGLQGLQDAAVENRNESPAVIGTMPDGFSNFASKCDGPNRVYVIFKGDSAYGSIEVVPNDERCTS